MDNLEKYIQKILDIQNEEKDMPLSEIELKEIALEMGMSESDWEAIQETFNAHLTRGIGYLNYKNWDDAINELEQAIILNPNHLKVLSNLAIGYTKLWEETHNETDKEKAEYYAKKCLEINPSDDFSIRLISNLKVVQKYKQKAINKSSLALLAIIILIGMLITIYSLNSKRSKRTQQPTPKPKVIKPKQPEVMEDILYTEGLGVPVRFIRDANAKGIKFEVESSDYNQYNDAYSYKLNADFTMEGIEVEKLKVKIELIDIDNKIIISDFEKVLDDYQPIAISGDVLPMDYLEYVKTEQFPKFKEIHISINSITKEDAPATYEPAKKINIEWENKPANMDIEVRERSTGIAQGYILDNELIRHEIVLEIKNVGNVSIKKLEFAIQYYNKKDELVDSKRAIICLSSAPKLKRGQTRVYGTSYGIKNLKLDDFNKYTLKVTDVQ